MKITAPVLYSLSLATLFSIATLASSACKNEEADKSPTKSSDAEKAEKAEKAETPTDPSTDPPGEPAKTDVGDAPSGDDEPAAVATAKGDQCLDPCLRLVDTPYQTIFDGRYNRAPQGLCKSCGGDAKKTCKSQPLDCKSMNYFRNCIYAAHGNTFKKEKWQKTFGAKPWYKANPDFKESDLSKVAAANVAVLKYESRACVKEPDYARMKNGTIQFEEDLDGDGKKDKITVRGSTLEINGTTRKLPGDPFDEAAIVDVKRGDKRKEVSLRSFAIEDDYNEVIATYANGKIETQAKTFYTMGLRFPGDGRLVGLSGNCGQRYWSEHTLKGGKLKQVKNLTLGKKVESECAACPFVYVSVDGKERYIGEILRNIRSADQATTQSLRMPSDLRQQLATKSMATVILREEKDETTYLDEIYVTTASGRVYPSVCKTSGSKPLFCKKDGRHHVLRQGDEVKLSFAAAGQSQIENVWATGYYVPN